MNDSRNRNLDPNQKRPLRGAEDTRLDQANVRSANWQRWGTYLPERQWGTVREDYSAQGDSWNSFTHDMARYRAYRWGEDGLLGYTDRQCRLCFAPTLWNGHDPILKERLFGLTGPEGNHGEDVKELYFYLDATPTASYAKALYKYPQAAFPYQRLLDENRARGYNNPEFELLDTGIFNDNRYFDVTVEYAKNAPEDILIRLTLTNHGPDPADLTVLPSAWFRNMWTWRDVEEDLAADDAKERRQPFMEQAPDSLAVLADHPTLGRFHLAPIADADSPQPADLLFTENNSNFAIMDPHRQAPEAGTPKAYTPQPYSKDAFDRFLLHGQTDAVNPEHRGTKAAFLYPLRLAPGASTQIRLRLVRLEDDAAPVPLDAPAFDACFQLRIHEADAFYAARIPDSFTPDEKNISRQAYAGLLWSKQFYYYVSELWLAGDEGQPLPPAERLQGRNSDWKHLFCRDIHSVPDKWEYPWFAAWDTAFHMIPMAEIDPRFAKDQLLLLLREWYLSPNGQIPAYEFNFGDVNPPVHSLAVWRVYKIAAARGADPNLDFLERAFQKLLLNFTWWVNRMDAEGRNLFGGGFLGLDNIGVFDRSSALPDGTCLSQADGTAWMGLFCSTMLTISLELAQTMPVYEDIASKFFEHYIFIIDAMNGRERMGLWDDTEGFYFDQLIADGQDPISLKVHSIVGLVPLFATGIIQQSAIEKLPGFHKRLKWFLKHKPQLASFVTKAETSDPGFSDAYLIALCPKDRLLRILKRVLNEDEFLSGFGIRSVSKLHAEQPFQVQLSGQHLQVAYVPGEGTDGMFGGNSNWRGPIWFPINFLLINALERYHLIYGDDLKVECPTGSGNFITLLEVSEEISRRLTRLFLKDETAQRPSQGDDRRFADNPNWKDLVLFHEYFHGETGRGLGASHQTGWTALVTTCMEKWHRKDPAAP